MREERYRATERALWDSVGVEPIERTVALERAGTTVRVLEVGDGPPVLFVHGASNGATSWAPLAARLPGFRCLLLDRPGCGLSAPLPHALGDIGALGVFADDLVADVLDGLGLPRAHVVGTSFGGYFSLRGAAAHPDRIDRLVLLSWSLGGPAETSPLYMRIATQPALGKVTARIPPTKGMTRSLLKQVGLRHAVESGRFGAVELAWFMSLMRDTRTMRNEIDTMPRLMTLRGFNEETLLPPARLARVTAPTYLLWGADDPMGGAETARRFAASLPNAELEMMDGAGHAPWMDDPTHVAQRLAEFWGRP